MSTFVIVAVIAALVVIVTFLRKRDASPHVRVPRREEPRKRARSLPVSGEPIPNLEEVVVIDFETTGLNPRKDRVISVAAISANIQEMIRNKGQDIRYFSARFNPECSIPPDASRIHGIFDQDVRDEKPFREHAESLLEFIGGRTIIAHNAEFDVAFLNAELKRCGLALPTGEVFCTMKHGARKLGRSRISLDALSREYKLGARKTSKHDALEDTILTLKIATAMAAEQQGLRLHTMEVGEA